MSHQHHVPEGVIQFLKHGLKVATARAINGAVGDDCFRGDAEDLRKDPGGLQRACRRTGQNQVRHGDGIPCIRRRKTGFRAAGLRKDPVEIGVLCKMFRMRMADYR